MVVKIDDARIEVELDVRRALTDLDEIESKLGQARARRRRRGPRAEPGGERRPGGRKFVAAAGLTAATAGGGLRRAVGFAAKLAGGLTIAEVIRNAPEIVRAVVGEETLSKRLVDLLQLPDFATEILTANAIGVTKIEDLVNDLSKRIAQVEATLKTTAKAAVIAYDLLRLGKLTEAGAGAIAVIRQAISPGGEPVDPAAAEAVGITVELLEVFDAFQAYNTSESLHRQRARGLQIRNFGDNLDGLFRAPGGGASK